MSRATTNLRKRLAISDARIQSLQRQLATAQEATRVAEKKAERAEKDALSPLARAVCIQVERDQSYRNYCDTYQCVLRFQPDAFRRAIYGQSDRMLNVSHVAEEIGYRIGREATRTIVEKIRADGVFA